MLRLRSFHRVRLFVTTNLQPCLLAEPVTVAVDRKPSASKAAPAKASDDEAKKTAPTTEAVQEAEGFRVHDEVEANFRGRGKWFKGVIAAVNKVAGRTTFRFGHQLIIIR